MTDQIATFDLPPVMKSEDCQKLDAFLRNHEDQLVSLNCRDVTRIGGQAAQVIVAHINFRQEKECAIVFDTPSEGFSGAVHRMGLGHILDAEGDAA